jgi:hypothetical protein
MLLVVRRLSFVGEWIANVFMELVNRVVTVMLYVLGFLAYVVLSPIVAVVEWVQFQRPPDSSRWAWAGAVVQEGLRIVLIGLIVLIALVVLFIALPYFLAHGIVWMNHHPVFWLVVLAWPAWLFIRSCRPT